jgi:precorrin-3B synthase
MAAPPRPRPDACPGVLDPHLAADGAVIRVRLPGGVLRPPQARALARCAEQFGDGAVHLTSRGNVQLRGLGVHDQRPAGLLADAGLLPSAAHERARNVLASPLSGIRGGLGDVRGLAGRLDRGLCADPGLAGLPGRVLFAVDDGRGDVTAARPDFGWLAAGPAAGWLVLGGTRTELVVTRAGAAAAMLEAARCFLAVRARTGATVWRVQELPGGAARVAAALGTRPVPGPPPRARIPRTVGSFLRRDGDTAVGAAPVLGELTGAQLRLVAELADGSLVTPWRTVLLPAAVAGTLGRLRDAGLVVDPGSAALRVSACAGTPGCARSRADVRAVARGLVHAARPAGRTHLVGCERRCGAPAGPSRDVVALDDGFLVDGRRVDRDGLVAAVAAGPIDGAGGAGGREEACP